MKYFSFGTIKNQDGQLALHLFLHDTKTTKLIADQSFTGEDIFKLVDKISFWIKLSLNIPKQHIEQTQDLPVSEILTGSIPIMSIGV